jgi:alcohol dehydrogenase
MHHIPTGSDEEALVMLSDILPTGLEIGVINGDVQPGDVVAIVGAGPVGISALLTAQLYSPAEIIMVDLDDNRLEQSKKFGATKTVNSSEGNAVEQVMELTDGKGVDVAIEAVGFPVTFDICQQILKPGGRLANVGVHGKPVDLRLEQLWIRNVKITTGLVSTSTTPMLLKAVQSEKIKPQQLITHRFPLNQIRQAYEVFGNAAKEKAMKVILNND